MVSSMPLSGESARTGPAVENSAIVRIHPAHGKPKLILLLACGVYFNKHGVHRKISEQTKGTNANGVADTSCEDIAPRPTKQRKIDQSDISADLPNLDASLRRSPRRPATVSKSGLSHTVAASSPGPRANHAFSLPQLPRSPHRNHRKQDAPTSSSLFNSIPHSTFDSDFTALNTDIFSTLTSDAPMPDTTEGMDPALSFDAIFSDIDMGKLFSDAPTNAAPEHGCPKAPAATHLLPDLFASQQLHSDAITEVDLPPSSPPRDRARDKLFPEALNATASEGGSPNVGDTPADTSNPTSSHLPNAIAQKAAESGITWSEDAVNALTNALLAQAAKAGQVDLSEQTLRDLFENFVSGASPEKRWSGDDSQHPGSTPIVSPSPQEDRGAENSKFNIEPVAEVNAEVALEMYAVCFYLPHARKLTYVDRWKNEVRDRFNKAI